MFDFLNRIGFQVSRAGNAVQNVFGGGVATDNNQYNFWGEKADTTYSDNPRAKAAYDQTIREGQALIQAGYSSPADVEARAREAADRWVDDPLSPITGPVNDFLTQNPVGQTLAPAVANGAGYSTQTGAHVGMQAPAATPGNFDVEGAADRAIADRVRKQTNTHYGDNLPGWPDTMSANAPNYVNRHPDDIGKPVPTAAAAPTNPGQPAAAAPTNPGQPAQNKPTTNEIQEWLKNPAVIGGIGSVVGGAGSIIAGKVAADGATAAGEDAAASADRAAQLQKDMFDQLRTDQAPWLEAGKRALHNLENFEQFDPAWSADKFQADPGYTFRLNEGMKALQNSAAARGGLLSGNTLKGITNYGQEAASQEYSNAYNRYNTQRNQRLNNLQSLANVGQTATQQVGNAGQNYANNAGNSMMNSGNALAAGRQGAANANASGYMGAGNALTNALGNYQGQSYLNNLLGGK